MQVRKWSAALLVTLVISAASCASPDETPAGAGADAVPSLQSPLPIQLDTLPLRPDGGEVIDVRARGMINVLVKSDARIRSKINEIIGYQYTQLEWINYLESYTNWLNKRVDCLKADSTAACDTLKKPGEPPIVRPPDSIPANPGG